jgi:hypothetical protein
VELKSVLSLNIKPKEKVDKITNIIIEDHGKISELIENFKKGTDIEKGTYATVLKQVSVSNPEIIEPYLDVLFDYITYKANRVKWGVPETIGNLAEKYPKRVEKAIPSLLENTMDKSTVVRWCAAYALSKIMLFNLSKRDELMNHINQIIAKEKNNGVKNVYLKAIKQIK